MTATTVTVHLSKARFAGARAVLDAWAEDGLRLKNQVLRTQRIARDEFRRAEAERKGEEPPASPRDPDGRRRADLAVLAAASVEFSAGKEAARVQPPPSSPDFRFLRPDFLKWMFGGSREAFKDKGHFQALPSRCAQALVQERCDEAKAFAAARAAWAAAPAAFTGRPRPPNHLPDNRLPALTIPVGSLDFQRREEELRGEARERIDVRRGPKGGACVAIPDVLLPRHVKGFPLTLVRFVPCGGAVDTGVKTKHGKRVFRPVSWKMPLVFDLGEEASEREERLAAARAAAEADGRAAKKTASKASAASKREAAPARKEEGKERDAALLESLRTKAAAGTLRVAGLDPGARRLATLAGAFPSVPTALAGSAFTGLNQWASKRAAELLSEAAAGREPSKEGETGPWTEGLGAILASRERKFSKWTDLPAKEAVRWVSENRVDLLVLGRAGDWKQSASGIGSAAERQKFTQIPHERILKRIEALCREAGVATVRVDEDHTSASSFLDGEVLPARAQAAASADELRKSGAFKARRSKGRLTRPDGTQMRADANGALNLARRGAEDLLGFRVDGPGLFSKMTNEERHGFRRPKRVRLHDLFPANRGASRKPRGHAGRMDSSVSGQKQAAAALPRVPAGSTLSFSTIPRGLP